MSDQGDRSATPGLRDERFGDWNDTTIRISRPLLCAMCRHATDKVRWRCTAFPQGIPDAITNNEHIHTRPYPGDHGIRFQYDWSTGGDDR